MKRGAKIGLGVAGGAVVVAAGALAYAKYGPKATATTPPSGGSGSTTTTGASGSMPALRIGQPFLTGATGLRGPFRGRAHGLGHSTNRMRAEGAFIGSVGGAASASAVTAQPGQVLNVPLTVGDIGPVPLYFLAHGYTWESGASPGSLGTVDIPGIGAVAISGHLTDAYGSSSAATGSASPGGSWSPTLQSEGQLAYSGYSAGVWVHLHVYRDAAMTQEVSGSPVAAWTPAFLTVALPGLSSLISFGIGSPSVNQVGVGR